MELIKGKKYWIRTLDIKDEDNENFKIKILDFLESQVDKRTAVYIKVYYSFFRSEKCWSEIDFLKQRLDAYSKHDELFDSKGIDRLEIQ
jgi:hypothetical protein